MIYLRIARPLKSDVKIELINVSAFYEHTTFYGLSINVTPDYGFSEKNNDLIVKNQSTYEQI